MFQSVLRCLSQRQTEEFDGVDAESGFTLIELMVVLLIIAILLAIAIPTFLGVTGSANDRAAQSNLTNALTEASAAYQSNNQSFQPIATMQGSAPEFQWVAANVVPGAGTNKISENPVDLVIAGDVQGIVLSSLSKSGTCWWVAQLSATPTYVGATGFNKAASGAGFQTGATTGGTFYASQSAAHGAAANCSAGYPEADTTASFTWGSSYSSLAAGAGVN